MKRSRSGCQSCRTRKIKCDEGRPSCRMCLKRNVACSYETKYQWIINSEFRKQKPTKLNYPALNESSTESPKYTYKPRIGPRSRHRVIGQEIISVNIFHPEALQRLETEMHELPFYEDEDPITSDDCPGSEQSFRKFVLQRIDHMQPYQKSVKQASGEPLVTQLATATGKQPYSEPWVSQDSHTGRALAEKSKNSSAENDQRVNAADFTVPSFRSADHIHSTTSSPPADLPPVFLLFDQSSLMSTSNTYTESAPSNSMLVQTEQDFFDHFVNITADELVPITYERNPFLSLLPELAKTDVVIWELLVAYGASHKSMLIHGSDPDPVDDQLVQKLISRCVKTLSRLRQSGLEQSHSNALLSATLLAMIEVDRGNAAKWRHFMKQGLEIIESRQTFSAWELGREVNSMSFRLIGYMCGIGNMSNSLAYPVLSFPSWPQWSGSLDYLTGVDLNLLPLFSEAAELIKLVKGLSAEPLSDWTKINFAALKIVQRMNDYWLDEYWPDSEITAMSILFQQALQIHVLRRILRFPMTHPTVQKLVKLAISTLDRWIPPASTMQRCMTFILASLASESLVPEYRTTLLIRLKHMALAGFAYNWKVCDDVRKHWERNTSLITAEETTLIV